MTIKDYKVVTEGVTEVGDILVTHHAWAGYNKYPITRVTKTLSKSERVSDGYEFTFTREIGWSMAKPYVSHSTLTYEVYRKVER